LDHWLFRVSQKGKKGTAKFRAGWGGGGKGKKHHSTDAISGVPGKSFVVLWEGKRADRLLGFSFASWESGLGERESP